MDIRHISALLLASTLSVFSATSNAGLISYSYSDSLPQESSIFFDRFDESLGVLDWVELEIRATMIVDPATVTCATSDTECVYDHGLWLNFFSGSAFTSRQILTDGRRSFTGTEPVFVGTGDSFYFTPGLSDLSEFSTSPNELQLLAGQFIPRLGGDAIYPDINVEAWLSYSFTPAAVPVPPTWLLVAFAGLALYRQSSVRQRSSKSRLRSFGSR